MASVCFDERDGRRQRRHLILDRQAGRHDASAPRPSITLTSDLVSFSSVLTPSIRTCLYRSGPESSRNASDTREVAASVGASQKRRMWAFTSRGSGGRVDEQGRSMASGCKGGSTGLVVMGGECLGEDERAGRTRAHLVLVWARNSHPLTRPDRTLPFARPRHLSHVQLCSRWTTVSTPLSHILAAQKIGRASCRERV